MKLFFLLPFLLTPFHVSAGCEDRILHIARDGEFLEKSRTRVIYAETSISQRKGLSNILTIPKDAGMVFVFRPERPISFWMKDTFLPLDIIFADESGFIFKIHQDAIPHDTTSIPSELPASYVLEIRGGRSEDIGLQIGDQLISKKIGNHCSGQG